MIDQQRRWTRWPGRALFPYLRLADFAVAQRVDFFVANSRFTQKRIANYYRRPSTVIYPPIDTTFYVPTPVLNKKYFLLVGRLTPTKRFDQAVRVCEKLQLPLVVVGTGYDLPRLRKLAGRQSHFVGKVSRLELRRYYRQARAILQPGEEDFGMATAEALACGTPVIAYRRGGASEVVEHCVTGLLYDEAQEEALAETLRRFLTKPHLFNQERLQRSALRFTKRRFYEEIERLVARVTKKQ